MGWGCADGMDMYLYTCVCEWWEGRRKFRNKGTQLFVKDSSLCLLHPEPHEQLRLVYPQSVSLLPPGTQSELLSKDNGVPWPFSFCSQEANLTTGVFISHSRFPEASQPLMNQSSLTTVRLLGGHHSVHSRQGH